MSEDWDSHWKEESKRTYWEHPDEDVVRFIASMCRDRVSDALDLGCGIGRHTRCLLDAGFRVTAVDSSLEALRILVDRVAGDGAKPVIVQGDYDADLFGPLAFDLVLAYNVIYHGTRAEMQNAIARVHGWLRPEGLFYFTCPSRKDGKYGHGHEIDSHTFCPENSVHPGGMHYFADGGDLDEFLRGYIQEVRTLKEGYWDNADVRQFSSQWHVIARKSDESRAAHRKEKGAWPAN